MRSTVRRSGPKILMPIGVRIPVVNMSMRFLIGIVQAFVTPGILSLPSRSAINSSFEIRSRQIRRNGAARKFGHRE